MIKVHTFYVNPTITTKEQWDAVALWAREHGYTDLAVGKNRGRQPVGCVTWYDAVKFCNAASELAGLAPVYRTPDGEIYRTGKEKHPVKTEPEHPGYRLPSSAEWETACRAGTDTPYYWGEMVDPRYACFAVGNSGDFRIQKVAEKYPNGFGLYDMSGNAAEWCFDSYMEEMRVLRGGSVAIDAVFTSAYEAHTSPEHSCFECSFRVFSDNEDAPYLEDLRKMSPFDGQFVPFVPVYRKNDAESVARELAYHTDDDTEIGKTVRALVSEGSFDAALDAYKAYIETVLRASTRGTRNNILKRNLGVREEVLSYPADRKWYGEQWEVPFLDPSTIMGTYYKNRDERYLGKYIELTDAYICRNKAEYDALEDRLLNALQNVPQAWNWYMGLDISNIGENMVDALWLAVDAGVYEKLPAYFVAEAILLTVTDVLYVLLRDNRDNVPNQRIHVMREMLSMAYLFPEYPLVRAAKQYVEKQVASHFEKVLYPDGTGFEQAFGYNEDIVPSYLSVCEDFPQLTIPEETGTYVTYLERMLDITRVPMGDHPATGTTSGGLLPPRFKGDEELRQQYIEGCVVRTWRCKMKLAWKDEERLVACQLGDLSDPPRFTSVHFPYSAMTVVRDGYSRDSSYLFFYAPRKGSGHANENVNDIFFCAFGRPLLVCAGSNSYQIRSFMTDDQVEIMPEIDRYQHSSVGRNTILVDGTSQSRLKNGDSCIPVRYEDVAGNYYHDGENFLYTEGFYGDGYYASEDPTHRREILRDNASGLFFLLDTMEAKEPHTYTQCWHFPPDIPKDPERLPRYGGMAGFPDEDIVTENDTIFTVQKGEANLFLRQFSSFDKTYTRYRGALHPAIGWYAQALAGRRHPKTDVHVTYEGKAGRTQLLTVMEASPTEHSKILSAVNIKDGEVSGCDLTLAGGEKILFRFRGEVGDITVGNVAYRARALLLHDDHAVLLSECGGVILRNGTETERIRKPVSFRWEEKDTYSYPAYTFEG